MEELALAHGLDLMGEAVVDCRRFSSPFFCFDIHCYCADEADTGARHTTHGWIPECLLFLSSWILFNTIPLVMYCYKAVSTDNRSVACLGTYPSTYVTGAR